MRPLGPIDAGFITIESRATPMHVGSLLLLRPPPGAGRDYLQELFQQFGSLVAVTYPNISDQGPRFHFTAACWRSTDRGRTWLLRGRIPFLPDEQADPKGSERDGFTEPAFTRLRDGSLYCVLRTSDGGRSWRTVFDAKLDPRIGRGHWGADIVCDGTTK